MGPGISSILCLEKTPQKQAAALGGREQRDEEKKEEEEAEEEEEEEDNPWPSKSLLISLLLLSLAKNGVQSLGSHPTSASLLG